MLPRAQRSTFRERPATERTTGPSRCLPPTGKYLRPYQSSVWSPLQQCAHTQLHRERDRVARLGAVSETVANQESHARSKQQSDGCRQPRVIRLAHHPGDAVVRMPAARRLSAWRTRSLTPDQSSSARRLPSASRDSACASSGRCSRPPRAARRVVLVRSPSERVAKSRGCSGWQSERLAGMGARPARFRP